MLTGKITFTEMNTKIKVFKIHYGISHLSMCTRKMDFKLSSEQYTQ